MPIKTPTKITTTVNVHLRPDTSVDSPAFRPDTTVRPVVETATASGSQLRPGRLAGNSDPDAITPAPMVTVHSTSSALDTVAAVTRPLDDYRLAAITSLPAADAAGLRMFKGRQYVEMADGGFVQVSKDSQSGFWRARLASESAPSGPLILRDSEGGLWHAMEHAQPSTFALSATRLEPFRISLDFSTATRDSDGLHRHDGKLYAVIDNHSYQVLHDPDASTPLAEVMRIVRPDDPVAADIDNIYSATRSGRSEPVVFDALQGWQGVVVGGAGGMQRGSPAHPVSPGLRERLHSAVNRLRTPQSRLRKLYPSFDSEQIRTLLAAQGDDVQGFLARKETEYKTLKHELAIWLKNTGLANGAVNPWVELAAQEVKRCWKHQTGTTLKLNLGNAPVAALTADFSHVRTLHLQAVGWSQGAESFLNGFTGIESLKIDASTLAEPPPSLGQMPALKHLELQANRIVLNEQTAGQLASLSQLEYLDLSDNPLGRSPDFSAMLQLKIVNLRNAQLDQWPTGLQHQRGMESVDLRDNQLREIPQTVINPAGDQLLAIANINRVTLIEGNPFASGYWRSLEVYWQRVTAEYPALFADARTNAFRIDGDIPEVAMVLRMYPDKNRQTAREYLIGLGEGAEATVSQRFEEFKLLEAQLQAYVADSQPGTSSVAGPEKLHAERIARIIKDCWLQESTFLQLPALHGQLPALTADFSRLKILSLGNAVWSDTADTFLSRLPNLEILIITGSGLEKLPPSISEMSRLVFLDLNSNQIKLDENSAGALSAMHQLTTINLSNNPLGTLPDFSAMSGLQVLSLNNTGISEWPIGLTDKTTLTTVDLTDNKLRTVPDAHIFPADDQLAVVARINNGIYLQGNDFPSAYWRKFDRYWRRLNERHRELMALAPPEAFDSENSRAQRYRRLFPAKSIKACREFIWSHEKGAVAPRLLALEQEFAVLKRQLDDWVFSGGNNRRGYIRANRLQINAQTRNDRNEARDRIIRCWRQDTPQKHANDGREIGQELDLSGLTLPTLPDLSIDFSHVGSLKLNNMNLTESPEGFLTRFRHVRWLNMAKNRLRELPPAVGEMHGMTRLFLQGNQLELTAETAQILAGRTTLRALWLQDNPQLGVVPDFGRIPDIREVDLSNTGIDRWPTGLFDQPQLTSVMLSNNQITTLPDFLINPTAERLAHSVQVNSGTQINNNPLTDATHDRLGIYRERLNAAGTPLQRRWNLLTTARPDVRIHLPVIAPQTLHPQWLAGIPADQASTRLTQLNGLKAQEGSDGFFNIINGLAHHEDFRRQAWEVVDVISDNSPSSRALRREIFDRACEAGCTDLAAATFTDLQVLAMTYKARVQAREDGNGNPLVKLSKGLFRLKQVDDIAAAQVAASRLIVNDPTVSAGEQHIHRMRISDPHEMTMAYRFGLKDRLQLPFQPQTLTFIGMAGVTPAMLDVAYRKVVAQDNSPEEVQALLATDFWQDFITHKYSTQFDAARQPYQEKQATLDEQLAKKGLPQTDYDTQTNDVTAQLAISEATLIQTLTRQELQPGESVEAPVQAD
ncbi:NEL-type E3 ubiquitin ligase domain-containing protein [Pseudomonas moraviensis]|uniref:NEL-type E3 ubiquitin ligase domain-containing protein n=1 Tax=Pseudomonas moraviensis TaxID=321662 RepID=UPI0020C20CF3|nr:NEL-type E3 ubiquitin ligase domain-containing protein [Pseudomonas moraviensis]